MRPVPITLFKPLAPSVPDAPVIARMSTPPDATRRTLINQLWADIVAAGIDAELDCLYIPAAANAQAAQLNWMQAAFDLTPINSPTFTADRGINGDGATSYYATGFNPADVPTSQYTRDDASMFVYVNSPGIFSTTQFELGQTRAFISTGYTNNNVRMQPNTTSFVSFNISGNTGQGFYGFQRDSSTTVARVFNTTFDPITLNATNIFNVPFLLCASMANGSVPSSFSTRRIAAAGWGGSLDSTKYQALNTAIYNYLNAIGAA